MEPIVPIREPDEQPVASTSSAPFHQYPRTVYTSVEYPGPVSHPVSLLKVVSQEDIDECFNTHPSDQTQTLEIRYRGLQDRQSVPVRGLKVASQKVLMKIVRKRRKAGRMQGGENEHDGGIFTANIMGTIAHTVRFRSMADWHYTPPEGPISSIVRSLIDLDYNAILEYSVPRLNETYFEPIEGSSEGDIKFRSTLELQPTPMMSLRHLPQTYNFKMPPQTVEEEVYDERTGQPKKRYINKARHMGYSLQLIGFGHPIGEVPSEPEQAIKDRLGTLNQAILEKLRKCLAERPLWMRWALLAQFTEVEKNELLTNKMYFPATCYTMGAGPFWKTMIRLGYDPCASSESGIYQRIHFFTQVNRNKPGFKKDKEEEQSALINRRPPGWWQAEQEVLIKEGKRPPINYNKDYIFDGKVLHRDRPDFQLCDITDPLLLQYIDDPKNLVAVCDPKDGWFNNATMELIKNIFRIKYMHLYENGVPASNLLCAGVIAEYENIMESSREDGNEGDDAVMKRIRVPKSVFDLKASSSIEGREDS